MPSGFDSATSFAAFKEAALALDRASKIKLSPKVSKQKIKQFRVLKHSYRGAYEIREASWERTSNEKSLERSPVSVKHLPFQELANVTLHRTSGPIEASGKKNNGLEMSILD